MEDIETVLDLLLRAARPRTGYPPGELDRMRPRRIAEWERLRTAGMLGVDDLRQMVNAMDAGRDYQRDHPLCEVDETLDEAMALGLGAEAIADLTALVDHTVRARLAVYSVRCAARTLAGESAEICRAGLTALVLTLDPTGTGRDSRDLMVSLAPLHVAAAAGPGAPALFDPAARLAPETARDDFTTFARRSDVTLEGFGWRLDASQPVRWIVADR